LGGCLRLKTTSPYKLPNAVVVIAIALLNLIAHEAIAASGSLSNNSTKEVRIVFHLIKRLNTAFNSIPNTAKLGILTVLVTGGSLAVDVHPVLANDLPNGRSFALQSNVNSYLDRFGDNPNPTRTKAHTWDKITSSATFTVSRNGVGGSSELKVGNTCMTPETGLNVDAIRIGTPVIFTTDCDNALNWKLIGGQLSIARSNGVWCADIPNGVKGPWQNIVMNRCNDGMTVRFSVQPPGGGGPVGGPVGGALQSFANRWLGRLVPSGVADIPALRGQCVSLVTKYQAEIGKRAGYFPGDYPVPAFRSFLAGDRRMAPEAQAHRSFDNIREGDILIIGNSINDGFSHTAIAMGNPVNGTVRILESNANNRAPNTTVTYGTLSPRRFVGALRY
jgi:hypothetical protein